MLIREKGLTPPIYPPPPGMARAEPVIVIVIGLPVIVMVIRSA